MANYKIHPEQEYLMLEEFYKNDDITRMPVELIRNETIYRFIRPFLDKGYLTQKQIANLVYTEFTKRDEEADENSIKYQLTLKTAWNHVTNARKFYYEDKEETPSVHRLRLTKKLYKMIDVLKIALPDNPSKISKIIIDTINKIADINQIKNSETDSQNNFGNDVYFILSDNAKDFPEIDEIPDKTLYKMIDEFVVDQELTPEQKNKLIRKDIDGVII